MTNEELITALRSVQSRSKAKLLDEAADRIEELEHLMKTLEKPHLVQAKRNGDGYDVHLSKVAKEVKDVVAIPDCFEI